MANKNPKAIALESVMKHPELSKLLKDAHASPQGSTIRRKARSVLQSAYRASYNRYTPTETFDGQGGPMIGPTQNSFTPPAPTQEQMQQATLDTNTYNGTITVKSPFKQAAPVYDPSQAPGQTNPQFYGGIAGDVGKAFGSAAVGVGQGALGAGAGFTKNIADPLAGVFETGFNAAGSGLLYGANKVGQQPLAPAEFSATGIKGLAATAFKNWATRPSPATEQQYRNELVQGFTLAANAIKGGQKVYDMIKVIKAKFPSLNESQINTGISNAIKAAGVKTAPTQTYTNINAATTPQTQPTQQTQQPAPVFKSGLSETQKKSITSLLGKITSGYKPNETDIKNLNYALGPNWQQFSTKAAGSPFIGPKLGETSVGAGTSQTMSDISSGTYTGADTGYDTGAATGATGPEAGSTDQQGVVEDGATWMKRMYDEGIGAEAAASLAMQDKQRVADLLGVPADSLPDSLLLGAQYQDVDKSLKQKYNLDNLENEILTRQRNGKNLGSVLEDYMTERDTYINTINNTLDSAKAWFNARGADTPYAVQDRDRYIGFLTTLKGGQQKRYADFLKMSTDMYGQETQALIDNYNIQKQNFTDEMANTKLATQEQYNNMKSTLKGMYDAYDTIMDRQGKIADLNKKGVLVNGQLASDIVDNSSSALSTQMKDADALKNMAPNNFSHETISGSNIQGDYEVALYNEPIMTAMQTFADNTMTEGGRAGDPTSVIKFYDTTIADTMDKVFRISTDTKDTNNQKVVNNYQNLIDQYLKNAYSIATNDTEKQNVLENAQKLAKTLTKKIKSSVAAYLGTDPKSKTVVDIQNAIKDLAYEHKWLGKDTPRTDAQITPEFITQWKKDHANISGFILDSIISAYQMQTAVKDSSGKSLNDGPADAFLMYQDANNPNNVSFHSPDSISVDYMAWNIITKGALSGLAQDSLI